MKHVNLQDQGYNKLLMTFKCFTSLVTWFCMDQALCFSKCFNVNIYHRTECSYPGCILHYGVRRGCAPVLGSFWPENSMIRVYFYWRISVIRVYFYLEFSGIGVYRYTPNPSNGC